MNIRDYAGNDIKTKIEKLMAESQLDEMTKRVLNLEQDIEALNTNLNNQKDELKEKLAEMTARCEKAEAVCHKWDTADIRPSSDLWEALVAWREAVK